MNKANVIAELERAIENAEANAAVLKQEASDLEPSDSSLEKFIELNNEHYECLENAICYRKTLAYLEAFLQEKEFADDAHSSDE